MPCTAERFDIYLCKNLLFPCKTQGLFQIQILIHLEQISQFFSIKTDISLSPIQLQPYKMRKMRQKAESDDPAF
ncbi:hypothetical protein D7V32_06405 [Acinetobacter tianfuensis]|uniref:Uncharacterized protein n=1 Tax=Acinetobacter tianfuensis TaxID=2419603 RepID=A0A3A8EFJ9_9GAMM|nr:hypothetical protein D7V32_06405 [Acinetobacter tianfuensis]